MTFELNATDVKKYAEQLVDLVQNQEEEEREARERKECLAEDVEKKKEEINRLEMEITQLNSEIMSLKLRDKAYQKEQSDLRNSITIIKFQIEKIKESIENTRKNELEDLKEFEKTVDEITEKFRSSPGIYDRRSLSKKMEEETEKRKLLLQKIQETRESYANFNREKGLRERRNENEELLNCVLPDSELYHLIEMTKNLDQVISDLKRQTETLDEKERKMKEFDMGIHSENARIAAAMEKDEKAASGKDQGSAERSRKEDEAASS